MSEKSTISKSVENTAKLAKEFLANLVPQSTATVVALSGDLGTGKTAFTKEVGVLLGIPRDDITSPTFVIMKIFELKANSHKLPFKHLIHIDAYRLEKEDELANLGWSDMIADPKNLILVEWPEMVKGLIPENAKRITFDHVDETTRSIQFS